MNGRVNLVGRINLLAGNDNRQDSGRRVQLSNRILRCRSQTKNRSPVAHRSCPHKIAGMDHIQPRILDVVCAAGRE